MLVNQFHKVGNTLLDLMGWQWLRIALDTNLQRFPGCIIAAGAVVMAAVATSSRTSLDFLDALAFCGFTAVAAWAGWCCVRAWCSVRWQALKRRWKDGEG
ncbi:hypothetical protein KZO25_11060 [Halomonas sp. ANAO-440]|uniref:hypothetical protein n=1 Tax=Halomonas sp. ANAO-440 TaxID=2861360 RepID=UPI001CAA6491|nr:hypothetical protein [Halomonas sp. ANAO-440]MBZ0330853.1 hypothetical protein [Halomonas sp. ANAO-440]